ncbi:MAG: hypothetical protein JSS64_15205 [Bacteroidetes bacterium]|nr:hypothetical protein [Bacteroidota bacterium]
MKKVVLSIFALAWALSSYAQLTKQDVFKGDVPLTFLGLDFTQAKFIGEATQWKDAGDITNSAMKEKYIPAWNSMFTSPSEQKNFKVAEATNRTNVDYAIEVTDKVNEGITNKDFFSEKMSDFPKLESTQVSAIVKKYNFQGKKGLGLIFIVEGMKKGAEKGDPSYANVVVTFVDMGSKAVLFTKRVEGKAGGFGFRNFWAGAWKSVLKNMKSDWSSWK